VSLKVNLTLAQSLNRVSIYLNGKLIHGPHFNSSTPQFFSCEIELDRILNALANGKVRAEIQRLLEIELNGW